RTSADVVGLGLADLRSHLGEDVRELVIERLAAASAEELAAQLLAAADGKSGVAAGAIAAEAGGHPMFIDALVRHRMLHPDAVGPVRLDEALVARTASLAPAAQKVLEMICLAGGPIEQQACAQAAGTPFGDFAGYVTSLRAANLVQTRGVRRDDAIE